MGNRKRSPGRRGDGMKGKGARNWRSLEDSRCNTGKLTEELDGQGSQSVGTSSQVEALCTNFSLHEVPRFRS